MPETQKAKLQRLRRQLLAEWRGIIPPRKDWPARELGDEVGKALEKLGASSTITEEDILLAWSDVVPPVIAGNTRPSGLREGVLEVSVLQPAILYTLERQMKRDVVRLLQSRFGRKNIRDVRFRIG